MPINRMISLAKAGYLTVSGLMAALGIAAITAPESAAVLLCRLAGGLLFLFGLVKLLGYCSRDLYRLAFQHDLAFGILLPILGAVLLLGSDRRLQLAFLLLGVLILTDALLKVQIALDSRSFGIERWHWILLPAAAAGGLGFVLVARLAFGRPVSGGLLGAALLAEAALNSTTILVAVKVIRRGQ